MIRVGQGYDAHRLVEGRKLILGGIEIPHGRGLLGHSDADALAHAVIDALLGAAGEGNIGVLFPDTDPRYEDADSMTLLHSVAERLRMLGWQIGNVDATIIAQAPKLSPFLGQMAARMAGELGIPSEAVSVKAKTEERMGFTGTEEGIAVQAVCLIER
ncbi:MAG: 2-C-methyl-D-erythritol 2,4-cyclodiphosphate synthase [Clostridiaceae bacterium]|nr:2-C-methyl-D-erythritol 2,4-cyclodiphosphate synthase [Clostridiaceae bacterium]